MSSRRCLWSSSTIPGRYTDPKTSGLTETIGDSGKTVTLELKDP
jgi:hypothetical protein